MQVNSRSILPKQISNKKYKLMLQYFHTFFMNIADFASEQNLLNIVLNIILIKA